MGRRTPEILIIHSDVANDIVVRGVARKIALLLKNENYFYYQPTKIFGSVVKEFDNSRLLRSALFIIVVTDKDTIKHGEKFQDWLEETKGICRLSSPSEYRILPVLLSRPGKWCQELTQFWLPDRTGAEKEEPTLWKRWYLKLDTKDLSDKSIKEQTSELFEILKTKKQRKYHEGLMRGLDIDKIEEPEGAGA